MSQDILLFSLQLLLDVAQVAVYILLVYGSFRLLADLPLEKVFKRVRFYQVLIPALALAGLAYGTAKAVLGLLFSFPLDFTKAWVPPMIKFLEGIVFAAVIYRLVCGFGRQELSGLSQPGWAGRLFLKLGINRRPRLKRWQKAVLLGVLVIGGGAYYYLSSQGIITRFSLFRPNYLEYRSGSPPFSFSYPSRFTVDQDPDNIFGDDYLVGIKLPSDSRIGCDVRGMKGQLRLTEDIDEVTSKLMATVSAGAEDYQILKSSFLEIDGEPGVSLLASFKGPLDEVIQTRQVFTAHGDLVYTLLCGTSRDTYEFFAKDFDHFIKSFAWE